MICFCSFTFSVDHILAQSIQALLTFKYMNAARKKIIAKCNGSSKKEPIVVRSDSEDIDEDCEEENRSRPCYEISMGSKYDESENPSCIDCNSTSITLKRQIKVNSLAEKQNFVIKEILVKNPDFTNKKKLAKDQSTLDNFIVDFHESKYLKTNKLIKNKQRQLTIFECKKKQKKEGKK